MAVTCSVKVSVDKKRYGSVKHSSPLFSIKKKKRKKKCSKILTGISFSVFLFFWLKNPFSDKGDVKLGLQMSQTESWCMTLDADC